MKKILENLKYSPKWVTHLGCVKGCLDYLNINITDAWLFGASGHAFVINIHEELSLPRFNLGLSLRIRLSTGINLIDRRN